MEPTPFTITLPDGSELRSDGKFQLYQSQHVFGQRIPDRITRHIHAERGVLNIINATIAEMYLVAFNAGARDYLPYNRLSMDLLPEATRFRVLPAIETLESWDEEFQYKWRQACGYVYCQRISVFYDSLKYDVLLNDLNCFFKKLYGIEGTVIAQVQACLSLERIMEAVLPNEFSTNGVTESHHRLTIGNRPLKVLCEALNRKYLFRPGLPVVDQTKYRESVSISLPWAAADPMALNPMLADYGLVLVERQLPVQVMQLKKN
jgi:hypothetical protein